MNTQRIQRALELLNHYADLGQRGVLSVNRQVTGLNWIEGGMVADEALCDLAALRVEAGHAPSVPAPEPKPTPALSTTSYSPDAGVPRKEAVLDALRLARLLNVRQYVYHPDGYVLVNPTDQVPGKFQTIGSHEAGFWINEDD